MAMVNHYYNEEKSRWKWLILLASFWSHAITWGMANAAGIFQTIFMDEFGGPGKVGMISIIPSLISTCLTFAGLISSVLSNKFGAKTVGWMGCLTAFTGLFLTSFATSVWFLYGTFCLIGIGFGLQYVPTITVLCQYFAKHRAIALGAACSGSPAGTFILAPFMRFLTNHYGWRGMFLILAAISLNLGVASSLFRPITLEPETPNGEPPTDEELQRLKKKVIRLKILRKPDFVCLLINNFALMFGYSAYYMHLPAFLKNVGFSENDGALFISVIGGSGIFGRITTALLAQKTGHFVGLYNFFLTISGACMLLTPFMPSTISIVIMVGFFGLTSNSMGTLIPLVITESVGLDCLSDGFGYILIAEGVGCLVGPPMAGVLYDITDSYIGSLCLASLLALFGCSIMIVLQAYTKITQHKSAKRRFRDDFMRQQSAISTKRLISVSYNDADSGFQDEDVERSEHASTCSANSKIPEINEDLADMVFYCSRSGNSDEDDD